MTEELLAVAAMVGLSLLLVYKSDQQSVIILKGKLFQAGKDQYIAAKIYHKHTKFLSVVSFVVGLVNLSVAAIFLANGNSFFPILAAFGLVFFGYGIWGRISSFRAADRELDQVGNAGLSESTR